MRDLAPTGSAIHNLFTAAGRIGMNILKTPWIRSVLGSTEEELLCSDFTAKAEIEFTSRCNLRCVYCYSLNPLHEGSDLDPELLDPIVDSLRRRGVLSVGVSGGGETTIVKDWHHYCDTMMDDGLDLFITTNLARELSDAEARTFARFSIVQVSVDTADAKLFKKLRRGGDLRTILYNMAKIRAQALKLDIKGPLFWWNAVVNDLTVNGLEDYVRFGLGQGVKHFNFLGMFSHQSSGETQVRPLKDLPKDDLLSIPPLLERVFNVVRKGGGSFVGRSVLEEVRGILEEEKGRAVDDGGSSSRRMQRSGMTRDCLDPWVYIKIAGDSSLKPCCATGESLGFLNRGDRFEDMVNNDLMREYRKGLLTGNLRSICRTCQLKGWTDIETLRLKVRLASAARGVLTALHRQGLLMPLLYRWRR